MYCEQAHLFVIYFLNPKTGRLRSHLIGEIILVKWVAVTATRVSLLSKALSTLADYIANLFQSAACRTRLHPRPQHSPVKPGAQRPTWQQQSCRTYRELPRPPRPPMFPYLVRILYLLTMDVLQGSQRDTLLLCTCQCPPKKRTWKSRTIWQEVEHLANSIDSVLTIDIAQKVQREYKAKISSQSKKNFVLEKDVRYLDSRIALLIQNRMALEEVL